MALIITEIYDSYKVYVYKQKSCLTSAYNQNWNELL